MSTGHIALILIDEGPLSIHRRATTLFELLFLHHIEKQKGASRGLVLDGSPRMPKNQLEERGLRASGRCTARL